ncbi:MAG: hypothetical protein ABSF28_07845 [Terracidiphilus sp.]|jgi:hypothetical protein
MKNPVAPSTTLKLGGVSYELLFDFESIALAEELTDRSLLTGLRSKDILAPSIRLVQAMLFACIHARHPEVTFAEAKLLINRKNLSSTWGSILSAWSAGMAEPDPDAEDDADPKTDQS